MNQATQVNAWDRLLIGNGEKVNLCQIKCKSPLDSGCNIYTYIHIYISYHVYKVDNAARAGVQSYSGWPLPLPRIQICQTQYYRSAVYMRTRATNLCLPHQENTLAGGRAVLACKTSFVRSRLPLRRVTLWHFLASDQRIHLLVFTYLPLGMQKLQNRWRDFHENLYCGISVTLVNTFWFPWNSKNNGHFYTWIWSELLSKFIGTKNIPSKICKSKCVIHTLRVIIAIYTKMSHCASR